MKAVGYSCIKERELGIMATEIKNINKNVDELKTIMSSFIESANKTYATKEEVNELKKHNEMQDKEISWGKKQIFTLIKDTSILTGIGYVILKLL